MGADRAALVAGLRALADDLERSDVPMPTHTPSAQWLIFTSGGTFSAKYDDNQKAETARIVQGLGGKWDKGMSHDSDLLDFTKDYGGGVTAKVVVDREEVCERVVVRTETVTIPASEAAIVPAKPERTETREIVEWRCGSLLADEAIA